MTSTSGSPSSARIEISSTYNQNGQYRFCSIKPFENFADTGHTYLLHLGVTDEPNPRIRK